MTAPTDERPPEAPPIEAEWVPVEPPPSFGNRSEPDNDTDERGRPLGHWVAAGGSGAILGGVGLFNLFGPVGLAAGAIVAAGGGIAYGVYRVRRGRRPGFKTTRMRTRQTRATSKLGSVGKGGRGKGLLGGRGPRLGKGGGPKLGKGGKLGSGKAGRLLGGKGPKLGAGRGGKLFGGGRGSKLGGKGGLGLPRGRRSTSRLGSIGASGRSSGGSLLGRGGKAGLGLGRRSGKLLGSKGKAGFGRWGSGTGKGASILGRGLGKAARATGRAAGRSAGRAALRTTAGRKAARGFLAAKASMVGSGSAWSRFRSAQRAARSTWHSPKNPFTAWAASIAAAITALTAMGHEKWQARQARKRGDTQTTTQTTTTTTTTGPGGTTRTTTRSTSTTTTRAIGPGVINPTHIYRRRSMTSSSPLAASSAEMYAVASTHTPQGMLTVARELDAFGEVPANVALSIRTYFTRVQTEKPVSPVVIEKAQELAKAFADLVALADEIGPLFRQVHAHDLDRLQNPRTNEGEWDYSRNV